MFGFFVDGNGFLVSRVRLDLLGDAESSHLIKDPLPDTPAQDGTVWQWDGSGWRLAPTPEAAVIHRSPVEVFEVGPMPDL